MKFSEFKRIVLEGVEEEIEDLSDEEIDKMVDDLEWEDISDLYDQEEDDEEEDEKVNEEVLDEKLSASSRIRKKMSMIRRKAKTTMARNIKLRRSAPNTVLQKRARVAARRALYKRFLRGRNKASLSASEKDQIEARVSRMKNIQANLAMKMMPKIRKLEQKRLASVRGKKK